MDLFSDVGPAIAAAARSIHSSQTLDETLRAIADAARTSIPGFDEVGISTVRATGEVETSAATGDIVYELDAVQYALGEGPCVETLREVAVEVVTAPRIRDDRRWPRYVPAAVERGLRSQLAVRLSLDKGKTLRGLNLYSTTSDDIGVEARATAELFAAHAAIALSSAHERETLNEALRTRKVIGQALGILMERYAIDEDRAFALLVRASNQGNVKLRTIAQRLVDHGNLAT